jgi:hypothetical protein
MILNTKRAPARKRVHMFGLVEKKKSKGAEVQIMGNDQIIRQL